MFLHYWINRLWSDRVSRIFTRVERLLGTHWTVDDVREHDKSGEPPTEVRLPLSLILQPDLLKGLKRIFEYHLLEDSDAAGAMLARMFAGAEAAGHGRDPEIERSVRSGKHEELGYLSKEEFLGFIRGARGHQRAAREQMAPPSPADGAGSE
jgi:hypothetical protein